MKREVSFRDSSGQQQQAVITMADWREADQKGLTLRQHLNLKYPTSADTADAFTQMCASAGLVLRPNAQYGITSTPMSNVFDELAPVEAAEVQHTNPVQSRILFPAFIMQYIEDKMTVDRSSAVAAFEQMVARTTTVPLYRAEQPVISYGQPSGPEDTRSMARSELSAPPKMLTITASERQLAIPELTLGVEISDRAMAATTLDLVGMALTRQSEVEGYARVGENLLALLQGDADIATMTSALSQVKVDTLDSSITSSGELTHLAYVKWLYTDLHKCRVTHIITDLAGALAIEARTGRPIVTQDDGKDGRINVKQSIFYPNLIDNVQIFIADPAMNWPANTIMGIDAGYAIERYRSVAASYSDIERFVMRRGTGFIISHGEIMTRMFDDAFKVLSLTTT